MRPFKKKTNYSYYSSYNTSRSRLRINRVILAGIGAFILVVGVVVMLNLTRIKLMWKGYSWGQTSEILSLNSDQENEILSHDKMDHITDWIDLSKKASYYDEYEKYLSMNKKMEYSDVVEFIDDVFDKQVPKLDSLGYKTNDIWDMLKTASQEDMQFIIDKNLTAKETEPFRKIEGCKLQNMEKYIEAYKQHKDYKYSVASTNYPFIISTNQIEEEYTITNPEELLTLVKKGFYLPSNYEPVDLVTPKIPIAPDSEDFKMRKVAAKALEEMTEAAKDEGYSLVLNSAYRSFKRQGEIYKEYEDKWGGLYAAEYVASPGASEHQTGLGVDLTSQSVIEGEKLVFGDTKEYKWVLKNAHNYGFIVRFETGTADITGIAHEPWHLRYVGKDVAKEIYEKGITFEEYCLYHNVIPAVSKK